MKFKSHQVSFVPGSNLQLLVEISRENRRILRFDLALALALLAGAGLGGVVLAGQAAAAPEVCKIDLRVDRVYELPYGKTKAPGALVTVSVSPPCKLGIARVDIECVWLDKGKPAYVGRGSVENVHPEFPATTEMLAQPIAGLQFDSARCRVSKTRR